MVPHDLHFLVREGPPADGQLAALVDVAIQPGSPALLENLGALAASALPSASSAIDELREVAEALAGAGRAVVVDLGLPRDFQYYTGVAFEFTSAGQSWGSGGRYRPTSPGTPDTACGLGLEAARLASHIASTTREPAVVAIVPAGANDLAEALAVARALHRSGVAAALAPADGAAPVSVTVSGRELTARTPGGDQVMSSLDDLIGLLVQFK